MYRIFIYLIDTSNYTPLLINTSNYTSRFICIEYRLTDSLLDCKRMSRASIAYPIAPDI